VNKYVAALALVLLAACSSPEPGTPQAQLAIAQRIHEEQVYQVKDTLGDVPSWYVKVPKDDDAIYAVGQATSGDLQFALERATLIAKNDIARRLAAKVSSEMHEFMLDGGTNISPAVQKKADRAIKEVVTEAEIVGYSIEKSEVQAAGAAYRAYVLMQYPFGDANKILVERIKADSDLNAKAEASKTFADLEKEIQASRAIKSSARGE
jgi:hypothetical protein